MTKVIHPALLMLRELRVAAGLSLAEAEERFGILAVVLGSYERGDRNPPLTKVEKIFNHYGYTLAAIPNNEKPVRLPADMASELRAIADQLEEQNVVSRVSPYRSPTA